MERNNEIAAVIFDCDGVLVDSEPIANRLIHRCLVDLGLELSAEETNDRFMGPSMQDWQFILLEIGPMSIQNTTGQVENWISHNPYPIIQQVAFPIV